MPSGDHATQVETWYDGETLRSAARVSAMSSAYWRWLAAPGSHGDVLADVDALVSVVRQFCLDDARGPVRAEGNQPRLENHRHEAVVLVRHAVLGKR